LPAPPAVAADLMRYRRAPSISWESRSSFSFLRTTPAKKPRTECCCQPVACMIVSIVVPSSPRSNARTFDCLLSGRRLGVVTSALASVSAAGDVFVVVFSRVAEPISFAVAVRGNTFFACLFALFRFAFAFDRAFVIRISIVAGHPLRPTTAAPQWPAASGARSWRAKSPLLRT